MARARIGIREARQNLSRYLRRVALGETFEITEHGRPVAMLGPVPERASTLDRLASEGRVIRGGGRNLAQLGPPLDPAGGPALSELLDDARGDRI